MVMLVDEILESRCEVELMMVDEILESRCEVELMMDVARWKVELVMELFKLEEDEWIKDVKEDSRDDVEFWMAESWFEEEARVTDSR